MSRNAFPAIEREYALREDQRAQEYEERNAGKPICLRTPWKWIEPTNHADLVKRLTEAAEYNAPDRERENLCSAAARAISLLLAKIERSK